MANVQMLSRDLVRPEIKSKVVAREITIESKKITPSEWGVINAVIYAMTDTDVRMVVNGCHGMHDASDKEIIRLLYHLGQKLVARKKYSRAGRVFAAITRVAPDFVNAYISRAETYDDREEYDKARKVLRMALKRFPENVIILRYLACLAEIQGNYTEMANWYIQILHADPQDSKTYLNLLQLLTDHAMYELLAEIPSTIPLPEMGEGEVFRALNLLVVAFDVTRQYDKALEYADQALTIKPKRIALWERKACIFAKINKNPEAYKCYRQMCIIKPHAKQYVAKAYSFGKKHKLIR